MSSKIGEYTNHNTRYFEELRAKLHQKLYLIRHKLTSKINMSPIQTASYVWLILLSELHQTAIYNWDQSQLKP